MADDLMRFEIEISDDRLRIIEELEAEYGRPIEDIIFQRIQELYEILSSRSSSHILKRLDAKRKLFHQ